MAISSADADDELEHAELVLFKCADACVYQVPPASTIGHRAEMWDVDNWLQEVAITVVTCEEACWVRLLVKDTGELFAECPVPPGKPLVTVVEPVVDSSRYYVLRVEDRLSKRHAFIGIGFRERAHASDFNAALHEHQQYLRRRREAETMRQQYEADAEVEAGGDSGPRQQRDYSLKEGQTIRIALPDKAGSGASTPVLKSGRAPLSLVSPSPLKMRPLAGAALGGLLPPPPPPAWTSPASPPTAAVTAAPDASQHSSHSMRVSDGRDSPRENEEGSSSSGGSSSTRAAHMADGLASVGQMQVRECADGSPGPIRSAVSLTGIERPALSRLIDAAACNLVSESETIAEDCPLDSRSSSADGPGEGPETTHGRGVSPVASGTQAQTAGLAQQLQGLSHDSREDGGDPKQSNDWGDFVG